MRNLKNQFLCLFMLIPMLVLLAHDIIPHNHHLHNSKPDEQVSIIHVHQHVESNACSHHKHDKSNWNHQHENKHESCCILAHNRVKKEVKYQIFLKADSIQLDCENTAKIRKFKVHKYNLIPEPLRFSPHRRGPPSSNLV